MPAAPSLPESATARAHTCAVRAQSRAAEQEESAARRAVGPVNWQLGGRLLAGARQQRRVRLPTPSSRPHSSGRKDGRCPALRWMSGGGGRGTQKPSCAWRKGANLPSLTGPESFTPSRGHCTRNTHWAASPASPGRSELGSASSEAEVGIGEAPGWLGRGPGLASGASWVSGGSEDSRRGWPLG